MGDERLSFHALTRDVIEKGICAECYGCVSFCTANELNVLSIKEDKPAYSDETSCLDDGICYLICPRTGELDKALTIKYRKRDSIGSYVAARSLRTTDPEISQVCCDGGVVTSLLAFLLDTRKIGGAVLSRRESLWNNEPMIATKPDELLECAGSSLTQSRSISDLGNLTTYSSIFSALTRSSLHDLMRLAVVGTPCQITTIRKMQLLHIVPSHLVNLTVGLFCFENFLMNEDGQKHLETKIGASLDQIEKINLKDEFIARLQDGRVQRLDLDELGPIVRPGCLACTDFTNYLADISVGGLGSPDGYTTTLVRTIEAQRLVNQAIAQGYLTETSSKNMIEDITKMAERKKRRGMRILSERVLSSA